MHKQSMIALMTVSPKSSRSWQGNVVTWTCYLQVRKNELWIRIWGNLGCSDHEKVEVMILTGGSSTKNRARTLNSRNENFNLILGLCGKVVLGGKVERLLYQYMREIRLQTPRSQRKKGRRWSRAEIPLQPVMKTTVRQLPCRVPRWSSSWRTVDCRKVRTHIGENLCSWPLGSIFYPFF